MVSDPCFWNVWMVTALRPRAQVDDEDPTGIKQTLQKGATHE
jgi:hypothetical protein